MNEISDTIFENFDLKKITTNIPILLKKDVPIMYKCKKTYHIFYHTFMNYYLIRIHNCLLTTYIKFSGYLQSGCIEK